MTTLGCALRSGAWLTGARIKTYSWLLLALTIAAMVGWIALADRLVESLDPADESRIHALWAVEVQRRLDEVRSGRVKAVPGDEALARVRGIVSG